MPKLPHNQKGMTLIAWVIILVLVISAFVMVVRLIPPYYESFAVSNSLKSLAQEPNIKQMSAFKVQDLFNRRLYVNDVKSVKASDLEISREGDKLTFRLDYEVRVHAIGNIDAVLNFDKKVSTE